MLRLTKPSREQVRTFLESQRGQPFSYPNPGATRNTAPRGYTADRNRVQLGTGMEVFGRAVDALRKWTMFDLGWVELCWPNAPIQVGTSVAVLAQHFGFWSVNVSRIIYVVDERGEHPRFGFAYGTLPEHAETGEERFTVELDPANETVWYDIFAFSRPKGLARAAYPASRMLQKRFALDSMAAMRRAMVAP